jgi:hypothetical protein
MHTWLSAALKLHRAQGESFPGPIKFKKLFEENKDQLTSSEIEIFGPWVNAYEKMSSASKLAGSGSVIAVGEPVDGGPSRISDDEEETVLYEDETGKSFSYGDRVIINSGKCVFLGKCMSVKDGDVIGVLKDGNTNKTWVKASLVSSSVE